MRKLILAFALFISGSSIAQTPTMQQKLYYTCKLWGFVKYYHSGVSNCMVNWDSVLISVLPAIDSAATSGSFNDVLDTMLAAAGPMAISTTYFPDTLAPELKRNRDWSWITSPVLRSDVQIQLDTIKNNFRPHQGCQVLTDTEYYRTLYNIWGGWLEFPQDTIMLHSSIYTTYPDTTHRMVMLFKFWNIVRYFNPYNYILDTSWDTILYNNVMPVTASANGLELSNLYMKMFKALDDAHVYGLSYDGYYGIPPGYYPPRVRLDYVGGKYIVVGSMETGINYGDVIVSVDGLTPTQWEDSLRPYYSAGNNSVFHRFMYENLLGRKTIGLSETIVTADSSGATHTNNVTTLNPSSYNSFLYGWFYPNDSLNNINWTKMECGVGYVNIGNLTIAGADSAYSVLYNAPAIIFDIRNYPLTNTAWTLADLMYSAPMSFAKDMIADPTYPGTYYWALDSLGIYGNSTPYAGKVIILVDEVTQSSAEYSTMILRRMPGSVVVGSQTAGADGNITWLYACNDMRVGWTSMGVFYPNGDSTQRIGIVPDTVIYPTVAGIRQHRDEVLEKALSIAGCNLYTKNAASAAPEIRVMPNPANDVVFIHAANMNGDHLYITLSDLAGRTVMQKQMNNTSNNISTSLDIHALPPGMYFLKVSSDAGEYINKIIKE